MCVCVCVNVLVLPQETGAISSTRTLSTHTCVTQTLTYVIPTGQRTTTHLQKHTHIRQLLHTHTDITHTHQMAHTHPHTNQTVVTHTHTHTWSQCHSGLAHGLSARCRPHAHVCRLTLGHGAQSPDRERERRVTRLPAALLSEYTHPSVWGELYLRDSCLHRCVFGTEASVCRSVRSSRL